MLFERVLQDVEELLSRAMEKRSVGCTQLNEQSSRSHAVFTLRIEGTNDSSKLKVRHVARGCTSARMDSLRAHCCHSYSHGLHTTTRRYRSAFDFLLFSSTLLFITAFSFFSSTPQSASAVYAASLALLRCLAC
jgi:hypothetical protein